LILSRRTTRVLAALALLIPIVGSGVLLIVGANPPGPCKSPVEVTGSRPEADSNVGYILNLKSRRWEKLKARWIAYRYDVDVSGVGWGFALIPQVPNQKLDQLRCSSLLQSISLNIRAELIRSDAT
jgi:hypothetical protein